MSVSVGGITYHMGPKNVGAPDDLEQAITGFIAGATKSLDIAVQELDSPAIARAIIDKRPGVRVRLVLEADYLRAPTYRPDPFDVGGPHEPNREIQNAMLRAATWVRSDFNPKIFHQKFIIRDNSAVLTGSTNFTTTGTTRNLNHVFVIEDPAVAKIYSKEYKEIRQGHFGKLSEGHDPKPPEEMVSQVPIRVLFAPDHSPEMEIMKQMLKARHRIDFAIFTFAESSGIDDALKAVAASGIKVRGVLDSRMSNQKWAANHDLVGRANIDVFRARRGMRKLHHKLMVIDERVVIGGSFNYTGPANRLNDENVIMFGSLKDDDDGASIAAQKTLAKYALDEIDRIIRVHSDPITP